MSDVLKLDWRCEGCNQLESVCDANTAKKQLTEIKAGTLMLRNHGCCPDCKHVMISKKELAAFCLGLADKLEAKLDAIIRNDKTPLYGYTNVVRNKNNEGEMPPSGRWKMPRELAKEAKEIIAALRGVAEK